MLIGKGVDSPVHLNPVSNLFWVLKVFVPFNEVSDEIAEFNFVRFA